MERIRTVDIKEHVGERVSFSGWVHNVRRMGGITFLLLRDGWGQVQAVTEEVSDLAPLSDGQLATETVISLEGTVVEEIQAPGGYELHDPRVRIISEAVEPPPAPLHRKRLQTSMPVLLDHAVVLNRHPQRRAIFRIASAILRGFREVLTTHHFTEIQTPKLVPSATESGAHVFRVDYFGKEAFLAQSPQFYKQIMVGVFERVFEIGPVFRSEPHATSRHINEYVSLDIEFGFIEDHFEVMAMVRNVLHGIFAEIKEECSSELELLQITTPQVPPSIPSIHFVEAQELILKRHGVDVRGEPDLSPQDERWLGRWAKETHGSDFIFVIGYPMAKRPFYTYPDPQRPAYSRSFDLLYSGTELITGGQRLHRYEDYLTALQRAGLSPEPFAYYLEAFRHGMPPHGGFAIGLERLLMQLTGVDNVRLTTLFPRDMNRLAP